MDVFRQSCCVQGTLKGKGQLWSKPIYLKLLCQSYNILVAFHGMACEQRKVTLHLAAFLFRFHHLSQKGNPFFPKVF